MIIDSGRNTDLFQRLESAKDAIEARLVTEPEMDESVLWEPTWRRRESRLAIVRTGDVYQDWDSRRDEYQEWMIRKFLLFRAVVWPRVSELTG